MKNKYEPWLDILGNTLDENDFMLNNEEYDRALNVYMNFIKFMNNIQKSFFLEQYNLDISSREADSIWELYLDEYLHFIDFIKKNKENSFLNKYEIDSVDFFYDDNRDFSFMNMHFSKLDNSEDMYCIPFSFSEKEVLDFIDKYRPPLISKTKQTYSNYLRVFNSLICLFNNTFVLFSKNLNFFAFVRKNYFIITFNTTQKYHPKPVFEITGALDLKFGQGYLGFDNLHKIEK